MASASASASTQPADSAPQFSACRCGTDKKLWNAKTPENSEMPTEECPNCKVLKSGHLLVSSKGIGWTSWKKRWFVLTRTSLVFYRSDPTAPPLRAAEPNVTLGGIELNNSGSVVVKDDKKLLTVQFPDGREGRTFSLKAETTEDLNDWKTALENALTQAPSPAQVLGQNSLFRSDLNDFTAAESSSEQGKDRDTTKSMVLGRPVLLALEDIDGTPSFLEKALRFIEDHGVKVEGILRQSADVEEVERRIREYEKGNDEFSPEEDAHIIGDCIKYVLREMPNYPVPASCCTALVEAFKGDRGNRVNAIHQTIYETFPEPNRQLLQRILNMMLTVETHKAVNRMSLSALAACMAPLLLRPLLAGDCELKGDFSMGGDGSMQLLQAAAAANHAQAIVIILLEDYDRIFNDDEYSEGSTYSDVYTESEGEVENEEYSDNDVDVADDDCYGDDAHDDNEVDGDETGEQSPGGSNSENESDSRSTKSGEKADVNINSGALSDAKHSPNQPHHEDRTVENAAPRQISHQSSTKMHPPLENGAKEENRVEKLNSSSVDLISRSTESGGKVGAKNQLTKSASQAAPEVSKRPVEKSSEQLRSKTTRPTVWGRTPAKKNLSMEEINYSSDDETAIKELESSKNDLESSIAEEAKENENLQDKIEQHKHVLHERRLKLQRDVEKLREQLQKEKDLRAALESGLTNAHGQGPLPSNIDGKTKADLEEVAHSEEDISKLKQQLKDLHDQIRNQLQISDESLCASCSHRKDHPGERVPQDGPYALRETSFNAEGRRIPHTLSSVSKYLLQKQNPNAAHRRTMHHSSSSIQMSEDHNSGGSESSTSLDGSRSMKQNGAPTKPLPDGEHGRRDIQKQHSSASQLHKYGSISSVDEHSLKKTASKNEDSGSMSTYALAKLTSRLNFLKERRAQLANELQNLDTAPRPQQGPSSNLPPRTAK